MEAMKTLEGCEEEDWDWTLVRRVPRMKEDADHDVNDNDEETMTRTTRTTTCVWLRDQRLRWTSFLPGRRVPNVRVGR